MFQAIYYVNDTMAEEVIVVIAKYDYKAENSQELNIKKNEKLTLLDDSKEWWKVQNILKQSGFVPSNYVYVKSKKSSLFSTMKSRLGRKNKNDPKMSPINTGHRALPTVRNGDTSSSEQNNSVLNDSQICEETPALTLYTYSAVRPDELSLTKGENIMVIEKSSDGWWKGKRNNNDIGWFPSNYVRCQELDLMDNVTYSTAAPLAVDQEMEVVVTLYPFIGKNQEDLNFIKGERLYIIERPINDPEWLRARNSRGEVGLVPKNYVQPAEDTECEAVTSTSSCTPHSQSNSSLSNTSSLSVVGISSRKQFRVSGPLAEKDWYYGKITRQQCEEVLTKYAEDGDFLIRDSESTVRTV